MENINNKPFLVEGERIATGSLKVSSENIVMPDDKTLFDTIIIINNRIKNLEDTLEQIRKRL